MSETTERDGPQDLWAIVEVIGHSQYAGRVVEVPETAGQPAFEKLLGTTSIFRVTPCTEEAARGAAAALRIRPLSMVALPSREPALPHYVDPEDTADT